MSSSSSSSSSRRLNIGEEINGYEKAPDALCKPWRRLENGLFHVFITVITTTPRLDYCRDLAIIHPEPFTLLENITVYASNHEGLATPVTAELVDGGEVLLQEDEIIRLSYFHQRLFGSVVAETLVHGRLKFQNRKKCYLIAPVSVAPATGHDRLRCIEWALVDSALMDNYGFRSRRMTDADLQSDGLQNLVLANENTHVLFRPIRLRHDKCGLSPYGTTKTTNYREYYKDKHSKDVRIDLPVIEAVSICGKAQQALRPNRKVKKRGRTEELLMDTVYVHRFSAGLVEFCSLLPAILYQIEALLRVQEFIDQVGLPADPPLVWEALTPSSTGLDFDWDRLIYLGEAFLKSSITTWSYFVNPHWEQDRITKVRQRCASHICLANLAVNNLKLQNYTFSKRFLAAYWEPPGFPEAPMAHSLVLRALGVKALGECTLALIGAFYLSGGTGMGLAFLRKIELSLDVTAVYVPRQFTGVGSELPGRLKRFFLEELGVIERILGYKFENPGTALRAFTHGSYKGADLITYQQLECAGDAILDLCVSEYLFLRFPTHTPGELTVLRQVLVNNDALALTCIRCRFPKFIVYQGDIMEATCAPYSEGIEHIPPEFKKQVLDLRLNDDIEDMWARQVHAKKGILPKLYGDIFEAILGAVFVDSGQNLVTTWGVFDRLTDFRTMEATELSRQRAMKHALANENVGRLKLTKSSMKKRTTKRRANLAFASLS